MTVTNAQPPRTRDRQARWAVALWLPLCWAVLVEPGLDADRAQPSWPAWAALVTVAVTFSAAVVLAARHLWARAPEGGPVGRPLACEVLVGVQGAVTVAAVAAYGSHWFPLLTLLAIGAGVAWRPSRAPYVLGLVTALAVVVPRAAGGTWGDAGTIALTAFLAGFGTYAFHRLFAVIAELAATRDELARTAVSEERARFSRDLHDLLGHTLSVIVVKAEAVRRLAPRDTGAAVEHATDIEAIGRQALAEVRQAVTGYRGTGLTQEVDRARTACEAASIVLSVTRGDQTFPSETEALLGWAVREGVTNVLRHSGATRCTIDVRQAPGGVRLTVEDDGGGARTPGVDGAGLRGLRERVASAGGRVEAAPTGSGFRLAVDVPVADRVGAA